MTNQFFPNAASEVVDPNRRATIPWRNWFASVNAALANGTITDDQLTAAVAKILISLGTTDGTADTIIDVVNTELTGIYPVLVSGDMRDGFLIKLPDGFGQYNIVNAPVVFENEPEPTWPGQDGKKGDPGKDGLPGMRGDDGDDAWPLAQDGKNGRDGRDAQGEPLLFSDIETGESWPQSGGLTLVDLTTNVTGILPAANGGTGIANNAACTITFSGNYGFTLTLTAATNVTFPTSGTLAVITAANSMTAVSTPSAPSSGFLQNYTKTLCGREMPFVRGPSGIERCLEMPEITSWHGWFKGFGSAAGTYVGIAGTNTVTPVQTSPTNTNRFTLMHRSTYSSVVTTPSQQIGSRATFNTLFRGSAAGIGGFWVVVRFGFTTIKTASRCFVGLSANTNNVTSDPSGLTNIAGFGFDVGDTAWTFMHNDNSGTATKDAIGGQATLATNNTGFIAVIGCYPNDSKIYYALYDLVQGTWLCDTSTNTDLPVNTTALGVNVVMSNGTANTAANDAQLGISTIDVYTES
jgi:hypothetical protein